MSESSSGVPNVRNEISIVAGPREWGDTRESWLARVPRRVSTVTYRTVKGLWYGEIDDPQHHAARDIRRAAELITARKEASALAVQFASTAGALRAKIFIALRLIGLSASLASLAVKIAPEIKGNLS